MLAKSLLSLSFTVIASTALAGTEIMPLTYEQFESAVPHVDLAECPADLPQADAFCRATIQHEEIHIFVFSESGDNPLIGFSSFPADGIASLLK